LKQNHEFLSKISQISFRHRMQNSFIG
jgi:hypothetical protein